MLAVKCQYVTISLFYAIEEIVLPTPIKAAFPSAKSRSAAWGSVAPPVRITGIDTAFLIASEKRGKVNFYIIKADLLHRLLKP